MDAINVLNGLISTYRPGTYVTWRAEDVASTNVFNADKTVALIGEAEGGIPGAAYAFTSAAQAQSVLRGGPLLEATLLAFNSAGQGGNLTVAAVNVLGGTQSTLTIPDATSGTFGTLTSAGYRERANQVKAQIYGDAAGGWSVVISDADNGFYLSGSRIGLGITLSYQGSGSAATVQVKLVGSKPTLVTTCTGATNDNLSITLTSSMTVTALCRAIQSSGPYVATPSRDGALPSTALDIQATAVDIKTAATNLPALKGDFARFFASAGGGEVIFVAGAGTAPGASFTGVFAGGTTVATATADWAKALDALNGVPFAYVVPLTGDQVIQAGLRASLATRNGAARSQFSMMLAGFDDALLPTDNTSGAVTTYLTAVTAALSTINDFQFQLVTNTGTTTLPVSSTRGLLPMYFVAAILAGEILGKGYNESQTYGFVPVSAPFPHFSTAQTDTITRFGGLCLELPTAGGAARVVRDRTTYSGSNNPIYESGLSVRVMNSVARGMKVLQDRFIPGSASTNRLARFQSEATDYFEARVALGDLTNEGIDDTGAPVPPYTFSIERTRAGGRQVISSSRVVPKSEFTVGEHTMVARSVEFQVSTN